MFTVRNAGIAWMLLAVAVVADFLWLYLARGSSRGPLTVILRMLSPVLLGLHPAALYSVIHCVFGVAFISAAVREGRKKLAWGLLLLLPMWQWAEAGILFMMSS